MNPTKTEVQKAFELHYLQQMRELAKQQKEDILAALETYIIDALGECDYVENNLSEDNIDNLYERISFAKISLRCAAKLEKIQDLINADEF